MFKYAQIDNLGRAISVSYLSSEVDAPSLILLGDVEDVQLGDIYADGVWTRPAPSTPEQPEQPGTPTLADVMAELQATRADNLAIMAALADLFESRLGGDV
ncbi:hypothetical protein WMW72_12115 [Paenibacillus filicis]|uniref:Uncharacterized protein n=1 Tax=Paenibacillus filicis TaxID=669464 RepID=A0ABU9DKD0_9BACL